LQDQSVSTALLSVFVCQTIKPPTSQLHAVGLVGYDHSCPITRPTKEIEKAKKTEIHEEKKIKDRLSLS
jgi:hypothetical protein